MSYIVVESHGTFRHIPLQGNVDEHFFNVPITNIFLEQFQQEVGHPVLFDDIVVMVLFKNKQHDIQWPRRLRALELHSTVLHSLVVPDHVGPHLELLHIDFSNLQKVPDLLHCTNLKKVILSHSQITQVNALHDLPRTLQVCNLRYNPIQRVIWGHATHPFREFNLSHCQLSDHLIEELEFKRGTTKLHFQMQNTYAHKEITRNNVDAYAVVHHLRQQMQELQQQKEPTTVYTSQTVHLSSICRHVQTSIVRMQDEVTKNQWIIPSYTDACRDFERSTKQMLAQPASTGSCADHSMFGCLRRAMWLSWVRPVYRHGQLQLAMLFLHQQESDHIKHSLLNMTYADLFSLVWCIVDHHPAKPNLCERLMTELVESNLVCFTGRISRLVNALVGIVDFVQISISVKEEVQMSVQRVLKALQDGTVSFAEALQQVKDIVNAPYHERDVDDALSSEYKQAWIDAMGAYRPDAVEWTSNDNQLFYISYDQRVYATMEDFDQERCSVGIRKDDGTIQWADASFT